MATVPSKVAQQDLGILARKINEAHEAARETWGEAVGAAQHAAKYAAEAGRLLTEAKGLAERGGFLDWVDEHFRGSRRTAQRYMAFHKSLSELDPDATNLSHLSMNALKKLMGDEPEDDEPEQPRAAVPDKPTPAPAAAPEPARIVQPAPGGNGPVAAPTPDGPRLAQPSPPEPQPEPGPATEPEPVPVVLDEVGQTIPDRSDLREAFAGVGPIDRTLSLLSQVTEAMNGVWGTPTGAMLSPLRQRIEGHFKEARNLLRQYTPHAVCPECKGVRGRCVRCDGRGWLTLEGWKRYERAEDARGGRGAA